MFVTPNFFKSSCFENIIKILSGADLFVKFEGVAPSYHSWSF